MNNFKLKRFFPYSRQNINSRDIAEVTRVLKSDFITQGPQFHYLKKSSLDIVVQNML